MKKMLTKKKLYLELALFLNNKLYEEKYLSYHLYNDTFNKLLTKLKEE